MAGRLLAVEQPGLGEQKRAPARYIFLDAVDAHPASADEEDDPVSLAEAHSLN